MINRTSDMIVATQNVLFPAFPDMAPGFYDSGNVLDNDPYGAIPLDQFGLLRTASAWTAAANAPGPANIWTSQATDSRVLSRMAQRVLSGEQTADQSIAQAVAECDKFLNDI